MPPQTGWGQILVPQRFASPPIGGLLVVQIMIVWSNNTVVVEEQTARRLTYAQLPGDEGKTSTERR